MQPTTIAIIQTKIDPNPEVNVRHLTDLTAAAASRGAQVVLLPELFETHYFPREMKKEFFALARPAKDNPTIQAFQAVAEKYRLAIPVSFYERDGEALYNSIAMVDPKGNVMGIYRKTFIPSGPGYEEKFYFKSGDTGFKTWKTPYGTLGVGICWDQWFPECARSMALQGADLLLYPTCIGSEPEPPHLDTKNLWQRAMIGHAVSNTIAVAASNRVGTEGNQTYYGSSFIVDHRGEFLVQADRVSEAVLLATCDFETMREDRKHFSLLEDYKLFYRKPA